jgi:hypothetical protein
MFFYWIPDGNGPATYATLSKIGLGYAFEDGQIAKRTNSSGPDGGPGAIVCRSSSPWSDKCGYFPDRQTWRKIPKLEGIYIGCPSEFKISAPGDIARPNLLPGRQVLLEDGFYWTIPIARRWHKVEDAAFYFPNVPCKGTYSEDGRWIDGEVKERYRRLWDLVNGYQEAVETAFDAADEGAESVSVEYPVDELAIEALKANYYVSHIEADLLGIYSAEVQASIFDVAMDADGLADIIKKKEPSDSSNS